MARKEELCHAHESYVTHINAAYATCVDEASRTHKYRDETHRENQKSTTIETHSQNTVQHTLQHALQHTLINVVGVDHRLRL